MLLDRKTDGRTYVKKLIVAFHNVANAPENVLNTSFLNIGAINVITYLGGVSVNFCQFFARSVSI
jgi:hypothetical protein